MPEAKHHTANEKTLPSLPKYVIIILSNQWWILVLREIFIFRFLKWGIVPIRDSAQETFKLFPSISPADKCSSTKFNILSIFHQKIKVIKVSKWQFFINCLKRQQFYQEPYEDEVEVIWS